MSRVFPILCYALCIFQPLCFSLDQASFYGNSFISIPFKEAKSTTSIHFKFRTRLSNALLLLVTGSTDYCIVKLENTLLKVSINLGGGESEISTPQSLILNDFKWHDIIIDRREANLTIIVDSTPTVRKKLPGKFFELNINFGLFVGGHGNDSDVFFGHHVNFRGCLEQVMYNGFLVLDIARRRQSQATVQAVTWNCASEFEADANHAISFVEAEAFMLIPRVIEKVLKLQFELKTISERGIIFYNTGVPSRAEHFALEVWDGKIKVILKYGDLVIENKSNVQISDGKWHKISLRITGTSIDLSINANLTTVVLPRGYFIEFDKVFYVGGVESSKRGRAMSKGLKTAHVSYKGCLKHITFSENKLGLADVLVSSGLLPGCLWEYRCIHNPCSGRNVCVQEGLDNFKCVCKQKDCKDTTEKIYAKTNLAEKLELLSLEPLEVIEGENILITTANLHVILDYHKYNIQETGIKFKVIESPKYGSITNEVWYEEKNFFTLSDVSRDKVHYVHDGSEYHKDFIVMEVQLFTGDHFILPSYLQGSFKFTLNVNVIPANDPPELKIPSTSVLRIAQGTRKLLDPNLLIVNDPDSSAKQLIYSTNKTSFGHFEYLHKPGVPITSFSQKDIENSQVVFVHKPSSTNETYISIQVSDGIETSSVAQFRVQTFPQFWRLQNNTGLVLLHESWAILTPTNLSFVSNVADATEDAEYNIVQGPQFGVVEVEKNGAFWEASVVFRSEDLRQRRVRYRHISSTPEFDEFQFVTSLNKSQKYTFRMTFAKCELVMRKNVQLNLNLTEEATISINNIEYQTQPVNLPSTSIRYLILKPPIYGYLLSAVSEYRMGYLDSFTQEDIISQNIKYRLHRKPYSEIHDFLTFRVLTPGCKNVTGDITIVSVPSNDTLTKVKTIFQRLKVEEGGRTSIGLKELNIEINFVSDLLFNITNLPKHGILQIFKQDIIDRNKTSYFTLSELKSNQLFYVHDDSETKYDSFKFMALSMRKEEDFQYVENFHIDITLKNDNSPVRAFDKKFYVVVNGQKLLTRDELLYTDADIDTKPIDIVYTYGDLPNGEVYDASNTSIKLSRFTQNDIDNRNVLFKHKGPVYGKIKLWVTDGQNHVNGILEVEASAPFIKVFSNKKLVLKHGGKVTISKEHLSYTTNLYADDNDVIYDIRTKPSFGRIVFGENSKETLQFTHAQLNSGDILYVNDVTTEGADEISVKVKCHDASSATQLRVWILPSSYWEPLILKTSKKLQVEESTSAVINNKILEIYQPDVLASSITYYVTEHPINGYITMLPSFKNAEEQADVRSFTQSTLNENRVVYIQSVANETQDKIVFNVTNGMISMTNVILDILIIPEHLHLGTNTMNVSEGGTVLISLVHLFVRTDYYKSKVTEYILVEQPKYGCVQVRKSCTKLAKFSYRELKAGLVHYKHDDSENLADEMKIVAVVGQKRSSPATLHVVVLPKNDQSPVVVNNTGLTMWEGGVTVITNEMLAAKDNDRPMEVLRYQVLGCWWGNVSLISDPYTSLQFFTQELINKDLVVFRHLNGSEAKFTFNVSDGLHSTKEHTFYISTKPVTLNIKVKSLHIFPLQKKYVTSSYMLSTVSDESRTIFYEVVAAPSLGRLMIETESGFSAVNNFTQDDLNSTKIFYEHMHPFADLYANDSFVFNIKSYLAEPLVKQRLNIDISVSSGGLDAYVSIPKIIVNEGGQVGIPLNLSGVVQFLEYHARVQSPIIHALVMAPQHGLVYFQNNQSLTTEFTQQQLESGQVLYQHDHSDSLGDNIYFSLFLLPGMIMLCNITVPIKIDPINDQPFHLITSAPRFSVVQGENHTISRHELYTQDADTSPDNLKYDIISGPKEGQIILLPTLKSSTQFSQRDINNEKVVYIHNGTSLTDTIPFRIWDGKFLPVYALLSIQIIPVYLNTSSGVPIFLQQGSNVVHLSDSQFIIDTNADVRSIKFLIKMPPKHGVLYVRDIPAAEFTFDEIVNKNVMYMQTDMTTANDSFSIFLGILSGNTSVGKTVTVAVIVQPLMQIGNFTVLTGDTNKITLSVLDATPLAKLTSSNPKYSIISKPKYGEIRKIIRSSGEHRNIFDTVVNIFTHEELQSGLIYYVVNNMEVGWAGLQDKFEFILGATIFQPAVGELKINIRSSSLNEIFATLPGPDDPAGHEGDYASSNMTRDYFFIVSMIAGVVVLGILIVIVIKCRSLEPEQLNKEEQCLQPIPLPRPPDRLMAASPPLKHQDGFNSPLLTALPQCKVTPINRNDVDIHGRYPYGVEEPADEWSSCDASDPACPSRNIMLRRNQYWV